MEAAAMHVASAAAHAVPRAVEVYNHRSVQRNKLAQLSAIIGQAEYTLDIVGAHCEDDPEKADARPLAGLLTKLKEAKALKLEAEKASEGDSGVTERAQWTLGLYSEKIQTMVNDCRDEIKLLLEIDSRKCVKKGELVENLHRRRMESLPAMQAPLPLKSDVVLVRRDAASVAVGCVVEVDPADESLKYKVEFLDGACDWFPASDVSLQLMLSESLVGPHLPLEVFFDDLLRSTGEADASKRNDLRNALAVFSANGIKSYGDLVRAKDLNSLDELRRLGLTESAQKLINDHIVQRCQLSEDSLRAAILASDYVFLVIGERGDGKTTMVNGLRDKEKTVDGMTGKNVRGITKMISAFPGKIHDSTNGTTYNVLYLDFPGYGDKDFPPTAWIAKFQTLLAPLLISKKKDAKRDGILDGILVLTAVTKCAFNASLQIQQKLMSLGFLSKENWQSVIFVGTMKDRCEDEDDIIHFEEGAVKLMFEDSAETSKKLYCCVSKFDYSPAKLKIAELINIKRSAAVAASAAVSASASVSASPSMMVAPRPENIARLQARIPEVQETVQGVFDLTGSTEGERDQFTDDLQTQIDLNRYFIGWPSVPAFSLSNFKRLLGAGAIVGVVVLNSMLFGTPGLLIYGVGWWLWNRRE